MDELFRLYRSVVHVWIRKNESFHDGVILEQPLMSRDPYMHVLTFFVYVISFPPMLSSVINIIVFQGKNIGLLHICPRVWT